MINDVVRNALEISNTALEYIRGGVVSYVFYEGGQTIELFAMPTQQRTFALEVDGYVHDAVLMDWIVRADELGGLQPTAAIIDGPSR